LEPPKFGNAPLHNLENQDCANNLIPGTIFNCAMNPNWRLHPRSNTAVVAMLPHQAAQRGIHLP